jgi:hypothetical protein
MEVVEKCKIGAMQNHIVVLVVSLIYFLIF